MLFRSEIKKSPNQAIIKLFLANESLAGHVKYYLENKFAGIRCVLNTEVVGKTATNENVTIFLNDGIDIHEVKRNINYSLRRFFGI